MNLRSALGAVRRQILCSFYAQTISIGNRGPIVSFTFDDFPRTASSVGAAILESFGARGTYYVAPGLMNTSDGLGDMCRIEDIISLMKRGHELGTQTMSHLSGRAVSSNAFREDVEQGRITAEKIAGVACPNFSYPYGHATLGTKKILGSILGSARSVIPGLNGPDVDLSLLLANRIYGGMDQAPTIQRLIADNVERRTWLIFYTHDVRPNPSEYGCTPALFEFAVAAAAKSASRIMTVEQLLRELQEVPDAVLRTSGQPVVTSV